MKPEEYRRRMRSLHQRLWMDAEAKHGPRSELEVSTLRAQLSMQQERAVDVALSMMIDCVEGRS